MDAVQIVTGRDGKKYLHARFSNRWRDRDFHSEPWHGGQIIASGAHADYEKWLDKHETFRPELWTWHVPGTQRKSRASWVGWSGDYMHAQWPLEADEAKAIEKMQGRLHKAGSRLGMSFGFYTRPSMYNEMDGSINAYRAFEASILPIEVAANQWNGDQEEFSGGKEKMAKFRNDKRAALVELHGEEFVKALETEDGDAAERLDLIADSKEATDDPGAAAGEASVAVDVPSYASEELVVAALERLKTDIESGIASVLEGMTAAIEAMSKRIISLEEVAKREEAAAKAEAAPPSVLSQWVKSGSVVGKTAAKVSASDEKLAGAAPKYQAHELDSLLQGISRTGGK